MYTELSRTPARQESYSVTQLCGLIDKANKAAATEGWKFGPQALAEMRAIIERMPDKLPAAPIRPQLVPKIEDGGLTDYLLAGCRPPFDLNNSAHGPVFPLLAGLALLQDVVRTKRLLLSVDQTVTSLLHQGRDRITVVDAGSGPVALLGMYAALISDNVHVTCIEANYDSVQFSKKIIEKFGLGNRVDVLHSDALRYGHRTQIDLLLSETMNVGLSNEPMVQIMTHYRPQISKGGVVLPSGVTVKASIVEETRLEKPSAWVFSRYSWCPVVSHDWTTAANYVAGDRLDRIFCEIDTTKLPPGKYLAMLSSDVRFGSFGITDYESYLSLPILLNDTCGMTMKFEIKDDTSRRPNKVQVDFKPGGDRAGRLVW